MDGLEPQTHNIDTNTICRCVLWAIGSYSEVDGNVDLEQVLSNWSKALTGMSSFLLHSEL